MKLHNTPINSEIPPNSTLAQTAAIIASKLVESPYTDPETKKICHGFLKDINAWPDWIFQISPASKEANTIDNQNTENTKAINIAIALLKSHKVDDNTKQECHEFLEKVEAWIPYLKKVLAEIDPEKATKLLLTELKRQYKTPPPNINLAYEINPKKIIKLTHAQSIILKELYQSNKGDPKKQPEVIENWGNKMYRVNTNDLPPQQYIIEIDKNNGQPLKIYAIAPPSTSVD